MIPLDIEMDESLLYSFISEKQDITTETSINAINTLFQFSQNSYFHTFHR